MKVLNFLGVRLPLLCPWSMTLDTNILYQRGRWCNIGISAKNIRNNLRFFLNIHFIEMIVFVFTDRRNLVTEYSFRTLSKEVDKIALGANMGRHSSNKNCHLNFIHFWEQKWNLIGYCLAWGTDFDHFALTTVNVATRLRFEDGILMH